MSNPYQEHFKKMRKDAGATKGKPRFQVKNDVVVPRRRKKGPPWGALLSSILLLAGSIWIYNNYEQAESYISKVEVRLFSLAGAQAEEQNLPANNQNQEVPTQEKVEAPKVAEKKSRELTPEELILFNKLEERRKALDQKEEELAQLEAELQQQKVLLEKKLEQLDSVRRNIASQLKEKVDGDQNRVDKLVAFYSSMKPKNAAKVFEKLDEDLVVEVLKKMKKRSAAEIMNLVEPQKAQALSEKFAGYRKR